MKARLENKSWHVLGLQPDGRSPKFFPCQLTTDRHISPSTSLLQSPTCRLLSIIPIALLSAISIWYFSQHFILVSHSIIHRSVVCFTFQHRFHFGISVLIHRRNLKMLHKKNVVKIDFLNGLEGSKVA